MGDLINILKKMSKYDECYTPDIAIKPLLEYLPRDKVIYEATSGMCKSVVNFLNKNGFTCIGSDGKNFLKDDLPQFDLIVTNPPYSIKDKFITKCYEIGKPFALLMPIATLQGNYRGKLFRKYGIELLVLNQRIDFTGKKSPHFGVAWFCWKLLPSQLLFTDIR